MYWSTLLLGSVWALCVVAKNVVKKRESALHVYGTRRDFIDCELEVHFEVFKQDNFHWEHYHVFFFVLFCFFFFDERLHVT